MHIEVLVEDRSGAILVEALLRSTLHSLSCQKSMSYAIRPHRGAGGFHFHWDEPPREHSGALLNLLPAKLRAYRQIYRPDENLLLVVLDSDQHAPDEMMLQLEKMRERYAPDLPTVLSLAIEELEAWALADEDALFDAFPEADRERYKLYRQDSVCGTWETMARILYPLEEAERIIRLGYPAVGQYKHIWATRLAPYLDARRNRSPSFRRFQSALLLELTRMGVLRAEATRRGDEAGE